VEHIHAEVAHAHHAHDCVHVCPVGVHEAVAGVDDSSDLDQFFLEKAEGIGVGHHDPGSLIVHDLGNGFGGKDAAFVGFDVHREVAAQRGTGRVSAVGGIRNDDLGPARTPALVIGMEDEDAAELAMGAGGRLQADGFHARDLRQKTFQFKHHPQEALRQGSRQQRVRPGESGQRCLPLIGFGIVFHGAGTQWIHSRVHSKIPGGEAGVMADHFNLTQVR